MVDLSTDLTSKEVFVKAFLMDDSVNKNYWHIPTSDMKKYATSFIGRPWIIHPSGNHPNYLKEGVVHNSPTFIEDILNVQDRYKTGDIVDVKYENTKEDPRKQAWYAYIRVSNQDVLQKIKNGSLSPYVSPQVYDLDAVEPGKPTTNFIPLHIASVNEPAYGDRARIKACCNGTGSACVKALKSAAIDAIGNVIDNHSSFLKNFDNNNNRLTNPTLNTGTNNNSMYPDQQSQNPIIANSGYNPFQGQQGQQPQQTPQYDQNGQILSQKNITQEVDANGDLITKTEDKKPKAQKQQNTIIATPPSPPLTTTPSTSQPQTQLESTQQPNNSNFQLPAEFVETMKNIQASMNGLQERLNNVENFKKSTEDEKIKAASEQQRKMLESVFTPEIIADENARQDIIEKFVALPLSDEQLKFVLDLVTTGTFNSSAPPQAPSPQNKKQAPPNAGFKGASVNRLTMNNNSGYVQNDPYKGAQIGSFARRIFADINADNI